MIQTSLVSASCTLGTFTSVIDSPFDTDTGPISIAYSPFIDDNCFVVTANDTDRTLSIFSVNTATGFLTETPGSPVNVGNFPYAAAFSPLINGNLFVAVPIYEDGTIPVFNVDLTTGFPTPVPDSPFTSQDPFPLD